MDEVMTTRIERKTRERLAIMELAEEIRACRGERTDLTSPENQEKSDATLKDVHRA